MDYPLNNQPATDRYDRMQYKYCGKSGLQLPLISLGDRKSTRLNSSHTQKSRMPSSA